LRERLPNSWATTRWRATDGPGSDG
jgi:hypothetical protein